MIDVMESWPPPDATEIAAMVRSKKITPLEAVDAAIARAETLQPKLNFMVTPLFERARARAKAGDLSGPFAGVPYLVKDMYDVEGAPTRWGSRFTARLPAASKSCPQVKAFEAAGLILIGKTALSEIGFLPTTEPLAFGPTRNPWNVGHSPGGSSGGSAAAVAAGVLPMADAADGGGSIRIPASACGVFGLKPSRGRLLGKQAPAAGVELTAEHCISRSVRDSAALFAVMEKTGKAANHAPVGMVREPSSRRLRIGCIFNDLNNRLPDADVCAATEWSIRLLEEMGHVVEPTTWPMDGADLFRDFANLFMSGALQVVGLARAAMSPKPLGLLSLALQVAGLAPGGIGPMPDRTLVESATLGMAQRGAGLPRGEVGRIKTRLSKYAELYARWFDRFDVVLSPVLRTPPVAIGHIHGDVPFDVLWERVLDYAAYTELHNAVGTPAMSVPLHWSANGLPVGIQFAARAGDERTLFELAYELEAAQPWATRRPPLFAGGASGDCGRMRQANSDEGARTKH